MSQSLRRRDGNSSTAKRRRLLRNQLGAFERLEKRLVLSHSPIDPIDLPDPIDPNNGQQNLLDIINSVPLNDIQNALDNFPVPYVLFAQAGNNAPVVVNKKAGSPIQIDVDDDKSTGKGAAVTTCASRSTRNSSPRRI